MPRYRHGAIIPLKRTMAIRKTVDPSGRYVSLHYGSEEPSPQDTLEALLAIASDPRHPPAVGILIDRRDVSVAPTAERVRYLISWLRDHLELFRGRRIAVVYAGQATYGMLRMAQILGDELPTTLKLFDVVEEAEAWLLS